MTKRIAGFSSFGECRPIGFPFHLFQIGGGILQDLFVGLERAFYLLELEPSVLDPEAPREFPATIETVAWRGVHLSLEDEGPEILRGINLSASAGTVTSIGIEPSGGPAAWENSFFTLVINSVKSAPVGIKDRP